MNNKSYLILLAILYLILQSATAQSAFYPLDKITPGLKGAGKTIFSGSEIEDFTFEILGVLRDTAPGQSMILARLGGEKIERYGVFAGMSGSPVYVDGDLVGAVAYGFNFAKEPIAGITPIQDMVEAFTPGGGGQQLAGSGISPYQLYTPTAVMSMLEQHRAAVLEISGDFPGFGPMTQLHTPLNFSGFSNRTLSHFAEQFRKFGFAPVASSASNQAEEWKNASPVKPGSTISAHLVMGDAEISAAGTVTYVSGNKVYAFGHPFLGLGYTDMPMSSAGVIGIIPSMMNSLKISNTGIPFGVISQDRSAGILGIAGEKAELIPVELRLKTSRNGEKRFNYEIVSDSLLTPLMLSYVIYNTLITSEKSMGRQTLQVVSRISIENYPEIYFQQSASGENSAQTDATAAAVAPVYLTLNSGFEDIKINRISLEISSVEQTKTASLEKVWMDQTEIKAGEELGVTVFLRHANGEISSEKYPIKIPEGISSGPLKLLVGDGISVAMHDARLRASEFTPRDFDQVIRAINNLKNNNRLYVRLFREEPGAIIEGLQSSSLPPSLMALYNSKKTRGDTLPIQYVVFMEHELPRSDSVIDGQQTIEVEVE